MNTLMELEKKNRSTIYKHFLQLMVIEKIYEIMERKRISTAELAEKAMLPEKQIKTWLEDDSRLTFNKIAVLFIALEEELIFSTRPKENV